MFKGNILDLEELLAPIPGSSPTGIGLSESMVLQELERKRRAILDGFYEVNEGGKAIDGRDLAANRRQQWTEIEQVAQTLFQTGKDMAVAVCLVEAAVSHAGWAAAAPGLRLLRFMQEMYFEELHPRADPDDDYPYLYRVNLIERLDQRLGVALCQLPLTDFGTAHNYSWADYRRIQSIRDSKPRWDIDGRREAEEQLGKVEEAAMSTDSAFYEELFQQFDETASEAALMVAFVDQHYSGIPERERPSLFNTRWAVDRSRNLARRLFSTREWKAQTGNPADGAFTA